MKQCVWIDGKFVDAKRATVPLLTHSFHYGSAVFEGIRFYETPRDPAVFRLKDHLKRLFFSAKTMGMKIPFLEKELAGAALDLILKNKLREGYIRPIAWYGEKMGLSPAGIVVHAAVACWPWGKYLKKEAVSVKIADLIRIHPRSSVMEAKISGHYANSILASLEAAKAGRDEALLLDWQGNIAEGPGENIFFVRGNAIAAPPRGSILPGITRDSIITIARGLGFKVKEKNIKPKDLRRYNEAFFTGTAAEVNAIGKIDNIVFNKGKEGRVTKLLRETYKQTVRGQIKKYGRWLTYCQK